jgi:hypothetical protein
VVGGMWREKEGRGAARPGNINFNVFQWYRFFNCLGIKTAEAKRIFDGYVWAGENNTEVSVVIRDHQKYQCNFQWLFMGRRKMSNFL